MVRKFKCWDCLNTFQADDQNRVKCPHCQSDNVDFYSLHFPYKKIFLGIAVFAVLGLGIYLILQKITNNNRANNDVAVIIDGEIDTIPQQITKEAENAYMNETGLKLTPSITPIGKKTLNDDDNTYSFKVAIENPPSTSFKIVLADKITGKTVAESMDGSFTGVPPSKADGGFYQIQIVDAKTDSVLYTQPMDGFLPVQKVDHKLTVSQLQQLLDAEDETLIGDGENPYLAPGYTITYKGLSNDDPHPTNLADVIEKVYDMNVWTSVKVESVEYDETKHIKNITLYITK